MSRSLCGTVLAAALAMVSPAHAHHVVSELGIAPVLPRTVVTVDVAAARFDVEGHTGSWQATTPSAEWSPLPQLSLFAALPFARVAVQGDDAHTGIGDLALSAKLRLVATPHGGFLLSAGLGTELPTGNDEHGLGGGHVELAPFLLASTAPWSDGPRSWVLYGVAAPRFAVGGHHHDDPATDGHSHGSFLAPHAERELWGRLMSALTFGDAYGALGGEGAAVFGDGRGYLAARAEAGTVVAHALHLYAAFDAGVAGERRFTVRGRAGVGWLF